MKFDHGAFMTELRQREGKVPAPLYANIMAALEAGLGQKKPAPVKAKAGEPAWLVEARKHVGTREIRGRKHNQKILGWIKKLGGWFTDDETPWCGTFAAYCLHMAGEGRPQHWYRAKAYSDWGVATPPRVGAIVVFGRRGGGHVGFAVGESRDNVYVLGGNQSNMVSIAPISKSRLIGYRWPKGVPLSDKRLPAMSGGAVSRNEA